MHDVLKSGYYESLLGYINEGWFVHELLKKERKMVFFFKNTNKDIIMTQEDRADFDIINICRFCEPETFSDKVRDHCRLTGIYRGPAHRKCDNNVTQKPFILFVFYNFID